MRQNKPYFSIIVVSLNAKNLIKTTIDSILCQTFLDYEIIVKDGCSVDGTIDLIPNKENIRVTVTPDSGIYGAMNQAIKISNGKYICFMNCGDFIIDKHVLQRIHKFDLSLSLPDNVIIFSDYIRKKVVYKLPKTISDFYLFRTPLNHQGMYINNKVFARFGFYDDKYRILGDYEHTLRTFKQGVKYLNCGFVTNEYLGGGISESKSGKKLKSKEYSAIVQRYFSKQQLLLYSIIIIISFKQFRQLLISDKSPLVLRKIYRGIVNFINNPRFT